MIKIFTDAAFDKFTQLACYCIVTLDGHQKDYYVENAEDCLNSGDAELAGLRAALDIARRWPGLVTIYCDSMTAIKIIAYEVIEEISDIPTNVSIQHIKGHQVLNRETIIGDEVKCHHWADVMAVSQLRRRLDKQKTVA